MGLPRFLSVLLCLPLLACGGGSPAPAPAAPTNSTPDGGTTPPPAFADCPDPAFTEGTSGGVFYACDCGTGADAACKAGDDSADGQSPETAFRTFEKVIQTFGSLPAGGMLGLCRGGAFNRVDNSGTLFNPACRSDQRCVMRDYKAAWGSGDEERPRINAVKDGDGLSLTDPGNANHEEGYVFLNLDLRGAKSYGSVGTGVFVYNDVDDVLACGLSISGFVLGIFPGDSNSPEADSDGKNSGIVLRNSQIFDNSGQGWLGGCDGCSVEYSSFINNGFGEASLNHNVYLGGHGDHMRAVGNTLYQSTIVGGKCTGASLVSHGQHDDLLIEGNDIHEDRGGITQGCWGIAISPAYAEDERLTNVVIRGNKVTNVGGYAIALGSCQDCLVENNVIINEEQNDQKAIISPADRRDSNDLMPSRITIRNNSIYFGPNVYGVGITLGGEGTGYSSTNNAVSYAGSGYWRCFNYDLPASAYTAIDNNVCQFSGDQGAWQGNQGTSMSLADFQAKGFDAHSLQVDPMFKGVTGPEYDLSPADASSPLVNAGDPSHSAPKDIAGTARDANPDIGAYEHK